MKKLMRYYITSHMKQKQEIRNLKRVLDKTKLWLENDKKFNQQNKILLDFINTWEKENETV